MYYDRIDIIEAIDLAKSKNSKEYMIYQYWFFNRGFKFQDYVCNGCPICQCCINISDVAIITVENFDYCCIMCNINKSEAINLLENFVLEDRWYL